MRNTNSTSARLAALCLIAAPAPACVMPQHRAIATVINTAIAGAGVAGEIGVAADNANPDSWHLFNKPIAELSSALIVVALFAELITLAAHEDRQPPRTPVAPAATPPPALPRLVDLDDSAADRPCFATGSGCRRSRSSR